MRLPLAQGHHGLQTVVDMNATSTDITRPDGSSTREAMGEKLPDENTKEASARLWLFQQQQNPTDVEFGARVDGTLMGLALPDEDIQQRDRIDYHGIEYEVVDITTLDDGGSVLQLVGLDKRINT